MPNTESQQSPLAGEAVDQAESLMMQAEIELMASVEEVEIVEVISTSSEVDEDIIDVVPEGEHEEPDAAQKAIQDDHSDDIFGDSALNAQSIKAPLLAEFDPVLAGPLQTHPFVDSLEPKFAPSAQSASPLTALRDDSIGVESEAATRSGGFSIGVPNVGNLARAAKRWLDGSNARVSQKALDTYHDALREFDDSQRMVLKAATDIEQGPLGSARDSYRKQGVTPDTKVISQMLEHPVVVRQLGEYEESINELELSARNVMKAGLRAGIEPETIDQMLSTKFNELQEDIKKKLDALWDKVGRPLAEFVERIAQRIVAVIGAVIGNGQSNTQSSSMG